MIFKKIIIVSGLFLALSCSHFQDGNKRDVASIGDVTNSTNVRTGIKIFRDKMTNIEIAQNLSGLKFDTPQKSSASVYRIISFINNNRNIILNLPNTVTIPLLDFYSEIKEGETQESFGKIIADEKSVSVRLQQATYYYRNKTSPYPVKMFVPFEGAEIVAIIRNGELISLNSSLIVPHFSDEVVESLSNVSFDDLKQSSKEDRVAVFNSIVSHPDKNDQHSAFKELFPNEGKQAARSWLTKFLMDSNLLYRLVANSQKKENAMVKLLLTKTSPNSPYRLVWSIDAPLGLPYKMFLSASKKSDRKFIKNISLLKDVTVKIYRGFIFKLDLFRINMGESENYVYSENTPASASVQALKNLSKVVEYFKTNYSWNSYDNKGSEIKGTIKLGHDYKQNAAWIGSPYFQFVFGQDGPSLANVTGALDIIGHEYFHSIVDGTANLSLEGEPAALEEHLADLFGVGFEAETLDLPYDQKIGESALVVNQKNGTDLAIRDFLLPKRSLTLQASNMKEIEKALGANCIPSPKNDLCGAHYSGGVLNLAVGKFIQFVGWDKIKDMLFQVMTKRLRSSSNFQDYRNQIIEECKITPQLTKSECEILNMNFSEVGIFAEIQDDHLWIEPEQNTCAELQEICNTIRQFNSQAIESCKLCGY